MRAWTEGGQLLYFWFDIRLWIRSMALSVNLDIDDPSEAQKTDFVGPFSAHFRFLFASREKSSQRSKLMEGRAQGEANLRIWNNVM